MSLVAKLRRGEGPYWGRLKRLAKAVLNLHVPVCGPTRWLFRGLYGAHLGVHEGLRWLARFAWYEPLFRSRCETVGPGFRVERLPYVLGSGRICLGARVEIGGKLDVSFNNRYHSKPELIVGDDCFIGHACVFTIAHSLHIGNHCLIAGDVVIADYDGHPIEADRRRAKEPNRPEEVRPVVVGDDVWIGRHAVILKGVTVGARSIVAASAVVTKHVPPDVVVAGNPARIVKHLRDVPDAIAPATRQVLLEMASS